MLIVAGVMFLGIVATGSEPINRRRHQPCVSQNGKTALIWAAQSGRWEVSQALMDAGANKETRDKVGVCVSRQGW